MFWVSRKAGKLKPQPESIAQGALGVMAQALLRDRGVVLREFVSGIGYVDVGIVLCAKLHVVELKILAAGAFTGASQLDQYLKKEHLNEGWLVVIDACPPFAKTAIPAEIMLSGGRRARVIVIDINPLPPSKV